MPKLRDIKGFMRLTLDKLPGIKADLVRLDDEWRERDFPKLVDHYVSGRIVILRQCIILETWEIQTRKCTSKEQATKNHESEPKTPAYIYLEK